MTSLMTVIFYGLSIAITHVCGFQVPAAPGATAQLITQQISRRQVRFEARTALVVFPRPRAVLSTRQGYRRVRAAAVHGAPPRAWPFIGRFGVATYEQAVLASALKKFRLGPHQAVLLSTAADPRCLAVVTRKYGWLTVTALVTAGAGSNAMRAGTDYGDWIDGKRVPRRPPGTINVLLIVSVDLTPGAMARLIITVTEAKSAALQDLGIKSSFTPGVLATGTGTDEVIVVAGRGHRQRLAGGHTKLGELAARATHQAVLRALIRQMKAYVKAHAGRPPKSVPPRARQHTLWPSLTCRTCPRPE